jgi:hypothetical protein
MLNQLTNIKKLVLLGAAVASTKVMLLLFAYFFDAETYNRFNQIYYTASIIILFSSLGFNIAVTRIGITLKILLASISINAIIVYIVLQLISAPFENTLEIITIILYSIFISAAGILIFQLLFAGRYKDYVVLTILYSVLHLLMIPAVILFDTNFFAALPIVAVLWFLSGVPRYIKVKGPSLQHISEFYKIAVSTFVINSAVSLALAADKYFVNHFFHIDLANAYTFAWGLTAPMFYIGVIIEQLLFSEDKPSKTSIIKRGFSLSASLVIIYAAALLVAINFFPNLVPLSINYKYVIQILSLMISGYSIYVIIHFPVNAYLFKSMSNEKQKTISIIFSVIIILFVILYAAIMQQLFEVDYILLLILTWSYIFTLLIAKIFIMFGKPAEEKPLTKITELTNLEP